MPAGLRTRWRNLLSGFWFLPGLVAGCFAGLAFLVLAIDRTAGFEGVDALFTGSGQAARTILSTIAGSVITVAGLAFSITIVSLQLVSQQFSPRATREFLADRLNQVAAGVFLGVFAYCLLVLRQVRDEGPGFAGFVPSLSVTLAIVLGVVGVAVLLVFIHHMAQSIKVANIAARVASQTLAAIDALYPEPYGEPEGKRAEEAAARWREERGEPTVVHPPRPGYVQQIRVDELVERLDAEGARIHVAVHPGAFVTERTELVALWPRRADGETAPDVHRAIVVDNERDVGDDAAFGLQQLKDVALRAMSPSLNDPSTAITCVGYLGACLERLAGRRFPAEVRRYGEHGTLVAVHRPTFADYLEEALPDVGRYATADARVISQLLRALELVASAARDARAEERLAPVAALAERIAGPALEQAVTEADREEVGEALERVRRLAGVRAGRAG